MQPLLGGAIGSPAAFTLAMTSAQTLVVEDPEDVGHSRMQLL
jgi:hypothetical protein